MPGSIDLQPPVGPVVSRIDPPGDALPIVFDSPHSGTDYPDDFAPAVSMQMVRWSVDDHVHELFANVPKHGAVLIAAEFPRIYVDPNRNEADIDPKLLAEVWPGPLAPSKKQKLGKSLIWRSIANGVPIYDRDLSVTEIRHRIRHYCQPYHDCVKSALDEAHARAGQVWHINCHSMAARAGSGHPDAGRERPDFTVSDRHGDSAAASFLHCVVESLRSFGYKVLVNDPYQGMELIARYSDPDAGRHSVQIEVNRRLYMTESTREKHDGFADLQDILGRLSGAVARFARDNGA